MDNNNYIDRIENLFLKNSPGNNLNTFNYNQNQIANNIF
jgi:hypothetical protein